MWHKIAAFIIKFRVALLIILLGLSGLMGYFASKVELSYEFTNAIPTDNPKYEEYQNFRKQFGEDGNLMMIGVQTTEFFTPGFFNDYAQLGKDIQKIAAVENVLSVPGAITFITDTSNPDSKKLKAIPIAGSFPLSNVDSFKHIFYNLPFYRDFLFNARSNAYIMAVRINKQVLNSKERSAVIENIVSLGNIFGEKHKTEMHYSGLPLIRTELATRVQHEMKLFLIMSFLLTAIILVIFFRSLTAVVASMIVVSVGVVWSIGTIVLLGYKITLLTALIPPLVVVIGIPNCVYFLNKYHAEYAKTPNKVKALLRMVDRMGIVTLFTNLTAAIGFGVFYFTKSTILKEFGLVAGINIIAIFFISLIFIPAVFSFLPAPKVRHISYLDSAWINKLLTTLTNWVFGHRVWIYSFTGFICFISMIGLFRLRTDSRIVDDLPQSDKVYRDLKFFEANFKGVMPLEIVIDTRKKRGVMRPDMFRKMDSLNSYLNSFTEVGKPLSIIEGLKFARQAYMQEDSTGFILPDSKELIFLAPSLQSKKNSKDTIFTKLINSFVDSSRQKARISVNMADVGTKHIPALMGNIRNYVNSLFSPKNYDVTFTGTTIVFMEGSRFIIHSLRDSLILAFIMIFGCMVVLFRSWRMLLISIVINIVPLLITAGIMGWMGIRIKPSTVLVFSVALGITIDVTIRFLVNFKQELSRHDEGIAATVHRTIHDTGLSIIYTSLILMAGFGVFMMSSFDGTKSLGFLTSLTLFLAMVANLTLQPALLLWMDKVKAKKAAESGWLVSELENDDINLKNV